MCMNSIIITVVIIFGVMMLIPKTRILIKGFLSMFVDDIAKTPEGVRAIYQEKIDEISKTYNIAHDNYKKLTGDKEILERSLNQDIKTKAEYDEKIQFLINVKNDYESAKLYATKGSELESRINNKMEELKKYDVLIEESKSSYELISKTLRDLKEEQQEQVRRMETSKQMEKVYDSINNVNLNTNTDKLLQSARKTVETSESKALGSKVLHEENIDTKIERLDKELSSLSSDDYIAKLMNK